MVDAKWQAGEVRGRWEAWERKGKQPLFSSNKLQRWLTEQGQPQPKGLCKAGFGNRWSPELVMASGNVLKHFSACPGTPQRWLYCFVFPPHWLQSKGSRKSLCWEILLILFGVRHLSPSAFSFYASLAVSERDPEWRCLWHFACIYLNSVFPFHLINSVCICYIQLVMECRIMHAWKTL